MIEKQTVMYEKSIIEGEPLYWFYTWSQYNGEFCWLWDEYKLTHEEALERYPLVSFKWIKFDYRSEDIIIWPDGVWCFRSELEEYNYKSDDYRVVPYQSEEWEVLNNE